MQNPPLTTQARADYTEAIRQRDEEISDIDEVTVRDEQDSQRNGPYRELPI